MTARDVCVLLGGPSAEHDVSLVSGRQIASALAARGHRVEGWLIDLDARWWQLPPPALDTGFPPTAYDEPASLDALGPCGAGEALSQLSRRDTPPVVFIALHGPYGEDGTVQALCESAGLIYTGSGVAASAVGMDKAVFKRLVEGLGLPVVPWRTVGAAAYSRERRAELASLEAFAYSLPDLRLVVKPARLGSSVGVAIVHQPTEPPELEFALADAFRFDDRAIVEAYVADARELEASVVGNDEASLQVFGPGEIFPGREFYDFRAKYEPGVSRTTGSPQLGAGVRERIRALAGKAFLAIGGEGFARVDFLLSGDDLYVSEINTIPGFTPISLFPVLCAEGGYDFGQIAEHILELAVERHAHRPAGRLTRADLP